MDLVDDGFYGVLIFCDVRWSSLCEDGIFDLGDVDFETSFLHGVGFPVSMPGPDLAGTGTYLLIQLGFFTHGDVIDAFFVIMLR